MDDVYLAGKSLRSFAADFRSKGGKHLFIDEIHKYPQWSLELKNIYQSLPDLKIAFAGSSTVEMVKHYSNLSQRATIFHLSTLSYREYLAMNGIVNLPIVDLPTLFANHHDLASEFSKSFSPNLHLDDYLTRGCYPIQAFGYEAFKRELETILQQTVDSDISYLDGYDPRNTYKIKLLVNMIAQSAPFKPNLVKMSNIIGVHRNTLILYFFHLEKTKLISLLYPSGSNVSILQKPELVFLSNPNIVHLLSHISPSREHLIKTYFINQLSALHSIKFVKRDVFEVDGKWHIAIAGGKKTVKKPFGQQQFLTLVDGIEIGTDSRVPLWMIGLCS
jgi:hypothetical protein